MKSNIRKLRNEKQISQTTLANVIGKTQQTVSHMEKDRDRISIESLITLADYFGVSTDYILGLEPEDAGRRPDSAKVGDMPEKINSFKSLVGENKKLLYQLALRLLLDSFDDDQGVIGAQESHM